VVSVGDREELVHATQKADRVLLPEEIVKEDAHRVEAERLCPSELASMVRGSNVTACHISSWLIAVLGMKLLPTSHPWNPPTRAPVP